MNLVRDERVLWYGRRSWISIWKGWVLLLLFGFFGLLFFPLLIIAFFILILILLKRYNTEYALTNKRVYSRRGIIARKGTDILFSKITDISMSQGMIGRLFDFGDVYFNTAGSGGYEGSFEGVSYPLDIVKKAREINQAIKEDEKIQERVERIKDKYYAGEISKEQFERAARKIRGQPANPSRTKSATKNHKRKLKKANDKSRSQKKKVLTKKSIKDKSKDEEKQVKKETNEEKTKQVEDESAEENEKRLQYCTSCGEKIKDEWDFCGYCGDEIGWQN